MLITINGILIRMDVNDISIIGRSTQGVRLIRLSEDELVATVARVKKDEETEEDIADEDNTTAELNNDSVIDSSETDSETEE